MFTQLTEEICPADPMLLDMIGVPPCYTEIIYVTSLSGQEYRIEAEIDQVDRVEGKYQFGTIKYYYHGQRHEHLDIVNANVDKYHTTRIISSDG